MDIEILDHGFPCTSLHVKDAHGAPEAAISCLRTGDSLTYRGLRQEAHTLARGLTRLGLGQGDTIAYRAQDGLDLYLLAASCALLGVSLFVFEGHAPAGARSAPRLVVCAAEGAAGPGSHEWVSVDELRLFGREDASTNAASCESSAAAWVGTPGLDRLAWTIRPLRTPLSLLACGCAGGADAGEVVLRIPVAERGSEHARVEAEYRTGDIGW